MCDGDFNEDAFVDGVDFGIFKNAFKSGKVGPSGLASADPSDPGGCPN
jgi:hypothetical protein